MIKKITVVFVTILLLVLVAYGLYVLMNSTTFQIFGKIVPRLETDKKVVALTFDDGPNTRTQEILDILSDKKVKATFFVIGSEIKKYPEETAAIFEAGHQLGNHSYSHPRFIFKSTSFIEEEVEKTNTLILEAGYTGTTTFRPPYGKKLVALPRYLASKNITTITWDIDPLQTLSGSASKKEITDLIVSRTQPGSIILLHPWYDGNSTTRAAIPEIIDRLRKEGYIFVTVNELLELEE